MPRLSKKTLSLICVAAVVQASAATAQMIALEPDDPPEAAAIDKSTATQGRARESASTTKSQPNRMLQAAAPGPVNEVPAEQSFTGVPENVRAENAPLVAPSARTKPPAPPAPEPQKVGTSKHGRLGSNTYSASSPAVLQPAVRSSTVSPNGAPSESTTNLKNWSRYSPAALQQQNRIYQNGTAPGKFVVSGEPLHYIKPIHLAPGQLSVQHRPPAAKLIAPSSRPHQSGCRKSAGVLSYSNTPGVIVCNRANSNIRPYATMPVRVYKELR